MHPLIHTVVAGTYIADVDAYVLANVSEMLPKDRN